MCPDPLSFTTCTRVALSLLVGTVLLVAPIAGRPASDADAITVRILLFSGRPDPSFTLTDPAEIARISDAVRAAQAQERASGQTVIPSKLGYKGVLIQNPKGLHGLPRQLAIYGGVMEVGVDRKAFLADPGRQLESALLSMAIDRKAIPENVAKRISEKGLQ